METKYAIFQQLSGAQIWHHEEDFFIIKNITFAPHSHEGFPLHMVIIFLCTSGELSGKIDDQEVTVTACTRLVLLAGKKIQINKISPNFSATIIGMSNEFLGELKLENAYRTYVLIRRSMLTPLTNHESIMWNDFVNLCIDILNLPRNPRKREALQQLVRGFNLVLAGHNEENHLNQPTPQVSNRNDIIMQQYTELLEKKYKEEHRLEYYANALHITPKYLSSCVQAASGHTASWWVNYHLLRDAEDMLHDTSLNIKEISTQLGFDDPSDFGKYFKRQKGISPMEFRRRR